MPDAPAVGDRPDLPDLADEVNAGEEHYNPGTGYIETTVVETTPHPDAAGAAPARGAPAEDPEEEHYNPATGYIETTPHPDPA